MFSVGDAVRLQSGGGWMTVVDVHEGSDSISCTWMAVDGTLGNATFPSAALKAVPQPRSASVAADIEIGDDLPPGPNLVYSTQKISGVGAAGLLGFMELQTVDDRLRTEVVVKDYLHLVDRAAPVPSDWDWTLALHAAHAQANDAGLSVSYRGINAMSVDANAMVPVGTDVDFCGCLIKPLNGIVASPTHDTLNVMFDVVDEGTPLVDVSIPLADTNLAAMSSRPLGGVEPGYWFLTSSVQICNRARNGTYSYAQSFKVIGDGVVQGPLSADLTASTWISVKHRANPRRWIELRNSTFPSDGYNNQTFIRVRRNMVRVVRSRVLEYINPHGLVDACALFDVDRASDVSFDDIIAPSRKQTGVTSGTYIFNVSAGAQIRYCECHTSPGRPVFASNYVNGLRVERCTLNRIDAHHSGHNIAAIDCTLTERGIFIGWGGGYISALRCIVYDSSVVGDRPDFSGDLFSGRLTVSDCEIRNSTGRTIAFVRLDSSGGGGVGNDYAPVRLPDSIIVERSRRVGPYPGADNLVLLGVDIAVQAGAVVYAPHQISVRGVAQNGPAYRFGNFVQLCRMLLHPNGWTTIDIVDCGGGPVAMTPFNPRGKTLDTGDEDSVSMRAIVGIRGCRAVYVQSYLRNSQLSLSECSVQRVDLRATAGNTSALEYYGCRLENPIILSGETHAKMCGAGVNASYPTVFSDCRVASDFDLSTASAIKGTVIRSGASPALPSGVTAALALAGWKASVFS
ncbi:DUF2158 domain-containing protein [Verticiella sediminum]|uniref:DUF2158 domain-containing protein n=1 Tax=Verticiella sediminum TaxID=1247510 RepID=A0A556AC45_9BURK|nr:DUF2158 domain-containing protein [Verticiella sediminum]TSH90466.1 DUF2158 domain-containing protein [Verticiella sediminum]